MVEIPANDIWGLWQWGLIPGTYGPSVDDGMYVMLTPLPPGQHNIHFTAKLGDGFELDVTYYLTVGSVED